MAKFTFWSEKIPKTSKHPEKNPKAPKSVEKTWTDMKACRREPESPEYFRKIKPKNSLKVSKNLKKHKKKILNPEKAQKMLKDLVKLNIIKVNKKKVFGAYTFAQYFTEFFLQSVVCVLLLRV